MSGAVELSIITATYNRLAYLRNGLETVLQQCSGRPVELIVSDDASTDGTWEWLAASLVPRGPQVACVRAERNRGPGPARNLALAHARGRFVLPVDSDMILMDGALDRVLEATRRYPDRTLLFFPCIEYPSMRRMDSVLGSREVDWEEFLYETVRGEMIPVYDRQYLEARGLRYPEFRSGGEGILWVNAIREKPAMFVDTPILFYRTDVPNRICTADYQLRNAADLAAIADRMLELFPEHLTKPARRAKAKRLLAAGTYHLLARGTRAARERLVEATLLGSLAAAAVWLASFLGNPVCRLAFRACRPGATKPAGNLELAAERHMP